METLSIPKKSLGRKGSKNRQGQEGRKAVKNLLD